ncbi:MAG: ABC transporter permease [Chitinophagaceae bacterium]|jgi:lipoprotein-releasing system permease protein|nr:ABC transporter permease [Chitinophagaceae bacterium]
MNIASFIAKRIAFNKQKSFSRFIIRLATAATAVSVAAMIITLAFVEGFQETIGQKVFSFWGHLRVQQSEPGRALVAEESSMQKDDSVYRLIKSTPNVKQIQAYATKLAVLEKNKEIEGVLIKGVEQNYDFAMLQPFLKSGRWIDFKDSLYSKEIVLSQSIADKLQVRAGDTVSCIFITSHNQNLSNASNLLSGLKPVIRKVLVAGIYKVGIEDYDKLFAIADIRLLRKANNWSNTQIGAYEVFVNDYHQTDSASNYLNRQLPQEWMSRSIQDVFPNIFGWLSILDVNRNVIFIVMSVVAIINLITCLLIFALERIRMIGVLKALGSANFVIQKIFLYHATIIALRGVIIGFLFGAGICLLQQYTGFIKLDESAYFISYAPVKIVWWQVILVCFASLTVCFLALILPALFVRSIKPVRAIRFE